MDWERITCYMLMLKVATMWAKGQDVSRRQT